MLLFLNVSAVLAADKPILNFRNEKVIGLTITKEIYHTKTSDEASPLRLGDTADRSFYSENQLSLDEFRLYLWAWNTNGEPARINVPYTRFNQYGNFYHYTNFELSDGTKVDLVIRPTVHGYEVYYYNADGEKIYQDKDDTSFKDKIGSAKNSENPNYAADYDSLSLDAKFKADFQTSAKPSKTFNTGSDGNAGSFYVSDFSDGDQVYFKDANLSSYDRFWITEDTDLLKLLSEEIGRAHDALPIYIKRMTASCPLLVIIRITMPEIPTAFWCIIPLTVPQMLL